MLDTKDKEKLQIIETTIRTLDKAVLVFCEKIGVPDWVEDKKVYRYKTPTSLHFQVLMAVNCKRSACLCTSFRGRISSRSRRINKNGRGV